MDKLAELTAYIPVDRRFAILRGEELSDHCWGCALFADISGFTSLTETLADELGPKRGADEMTRHLDIVYGGLIGEVERYHGSVISFAGDAITCWFDNDNGRRAVAAALDMQDVMHGFEAVRTPAGAVVPLAVKIALASGEARRFMVGDPGIQCIDTLAGATLDRMAAAEKHAKRGEVVATSEVVSALAGDIETTPVRDAKPEGSSEPKGDGSHPSDILGTYYVVRRLLVQVPQDPWPHLPPDALDEEQVRPWVLPAVYERLLAGQGNFLSEIRPVVPLFLHFGGIDYDNDPDAGQRLDAFVRWVQNIVTQYGGSLLELVIGDKGSVLYSVFGAPVAHDDAPLRAVAASVELRSVPPELGYVSSLQLGISWGRMRSGPYGGPTRRNYGVLGDQVNLAARLMARATPGEVLVSRRIAQAVSKQYALRELGEISVKGKREPVLVSSVLGPSSAPAHHADTYLPDTLLVGRDSELAQLSGALTESVSGRGLILRIEGPPGVGKSHLSGELIRQARERGMQVAVGASQSTSTGVAYAPWRQIVRSLLEQVEGCRLQVESSSLQTISEVEKRLLARNPDWALRLPLLGDLLGVTFPENATTAAFDPKLRQAALFDLIGEMIESWATEQPLLLLADDVHWMDAASQDLTLAVARRVGQISALLILVNRPPLQDQQIVPGVDQLPWHRRLNLGDLSPEGVAALLENRLRGPVSPLVSSLIQLETQGNPFFVEEVIDSLRESGGLQRAEALGAANREADAGEWILSEKLIDALRAADGLQWQDGQWVVAPTASLAVLHQGLPDTIEGVVLSRIDRLPEAHKLTLRVASVIGRTFALDLLAFAHPMQPNMDELLEQIEVLETRDFARLELQGSPPTYIFKHNITHDVAYGTLLNEQRKQLHKAVSDGLERLTPEDVGQLAYHTFAGEDWGRALRYQEQAAQYTQKLFANHQAIEHFRKALVCADKLPEEEMAALCRQIHIGLGELFTATGQYTTAFEHLQKGLQISIALADLDSQARACRWMARAYENLGDYSAALDWIGQGLEVLGDKETTATAELLSIAGLIHSRLGNHNQALQNCRSSMRLAKKLGEKSTLAFGYNLLGHITRLRGDKNQAVEHFESALELYGQVDNTGGQAISHNQIANVYFDLSKWFDADHHYRLARDIFNRIGDAYNLVFLDNNLGGIALNQGRLDEALQFYNEALQSLEQIGGSPYVIGTLHMNLGATFVRRGAIGEAKEHLRRSRDYFDQAKVRDFLPEMYRHLAEAALSARELAEAMTEGEQALSLARELNMLGEEGCALRVLGEIAERMEQGAQAEQYLTDSLGILREVGDEYESARTELALASLLISRDQGSEVRDQLVNANPRGQGIASLERCMATFERLGALADLSKAAALRQWTTNDGRQTAS